VDAVDVACTVNASASKKDFTASLQIDFVRERPTYRNELLLLLLNQEWRLQK